MIKVTYDPSADAAYIALRPLQRGDSKKMFACPPDEVGGMINLDFDSEGRLVGVEVLSASKLLPTSLLSAAIRPGTGGPTG